MFGDGIANLWERQPISLISICVHSKPTETICPVTAHLLWHASQDTRDRWIVPGIFKILEGPLLKSGRKGSKWPTHIYICTWNGELFLSKTSPISGPHHRLLFLHDKFLARKDFALRKNWLPGVSNYSQSHLIKIANQETFSSQSPTSTISHQGSYLSSIIFWSLSLHLDEPETQQAAVLRSGEHRIAIWPISEFFSNILSIHKQKSWSHHNTEAMVVQQLDRYMEMRP